MLFKIRVSASGELADGNKVSVASTTSNHKWSDFGAFVRSQDHLVPGGSTGGRADHCVGSAESQRE